MLPSCIANTLKQCSYCLSAAIHFTSPATTHRRNKLKHYLISRPPSGVCTPWIFHRLLHERTDCYLCAVRAGPVTCVLCWLGLLPVCCAGWACYLCAVLAGPVTCVLCWLGLLPVCCAGWACYLCAVLAGPVTCVLCWLGLLHVWCAGWACYLCAVLAGPVTCVLCWLGLLPVCCAGWACYLCAVLAADWACYLCAVLAGPVTCVLCWLGLLPACCAGCRPARAASVRRGTLRGRAPGSGRWASPSPATAPPRPRPRPRPHPRPRRPAAGGSRRASACGTRAPRCAAVRRRPPPAPTAAPTPTGRTGGRAGRATRRATPPSWRRHRRRRRRRSASARASAASRAWRGRDTAPRRARRNTGWAWRATTSPGGGDTNQGHARGNDSVVSTFCILPFQLDNLLSNHKVTIK